MTKTKSMNGYRNFFIIMGVLCLAAVVLNLVVRRGPVQDANAVNDLRSISGSIDGYYSSQSHLPAALSDIKTNLQSATWQRIGNYEYVPEIADKYRLCATFASAGDNTNGGISVPYPGSANPDPGTHTKGHQCFEYTANVFNSGGPKGL